MNSPKLLLVLLFFMFSFSTSAQNANGKNIDVNKDIDLVKVYTLYVEDGYGTPAIYKTLANKTYFESDYVAAKKWYEKLFETELPINIIHKKRYEQTLKALKVGVLVNSIIAVDEQN